VFKKSVTFDDMY